MTALGFIETKGLLGAIEAADAMLKAASVRLLEKNCVGGGLVTISVAGEVSAVKAAVDAATVAVQRIPGATLVSGHVIARPDTELAHIICVQSAPVVSQDACHLKEVTPMQSVEPLTPSLAPVVEAPAKEAQGAKPAKVVFERHSNGQLKKMSVSKLQQVALSLPGLSLTREEAAVAGKKELIEAITNVYRQKEE